MAALHHVLAVDDHVVAQVVKAHLVVGAVGDVAAIRLPPFLAGEVVHNDAHRHSHEAEQFTHVLALELGQVIIDRDNVHTLTAQRIEVGRQASRQGLAFTGFHLCDATLVQHNAADELHIEWPHAQCAAGGLPHGGKGLGQQIIQRLAILMTLAELLCLLGQLFVRQILKVGFQRLHGIGDFAQRL